MKTLGRVLIILTVFAVVMGSTYFVVNAGSSSSSAPAFQRGGDGLRNNGERPGNQNEGGRGNIMFGLLKNTILVAFIVLVIALPKNLMQQKRRAVPVRIE